MEFLVIVSKLLAWSTGKSSEYNLLKVSSASFSASTWYDVTRLMMRPRNMNIRMFDIICLSIMNEDVVEGMVVDKLLKQGAIIMILTKNDLQ